MLHNNAHRFNFSKAESFSANTSHADYQVGNVEFDDHTMGVVISRGAGTLGTESIENVLTSSTTAIVLRMDAGATVTDRNILKTEIDALITGGSDEGELLSAALLRADVRDVSGLKGTFDNVAFGSSAEKLNDCDFEGVVFNDPVDEGVAAVIQDIINEETLLAAGQSVEFRFPQAGELLATSSSPAVSGTEVRVRFEADATSGALGQQVDVAGAGFEEIGNRDETLLSAVRSFQLAKTLAERERSTPVASRSQRARDTAEIDAREAAASLTLGEFGPGMTVGGGFEREININGTSVTFDNDTTGLKSPVPPSNVRVRAGDSEFYISRDDASQLLQRFDRQEGLSNLVDDIRSSARLATRDSGPVASDRGRVFNSGSREADTGITSIQAFDNGTLDTTATLGLQGGPTIRVSAGSAHSTHVEQLAQTLVEASNSDDVKRAVGEVFRAGDELTVREVGGTGAVLEMGLSAGRPSHRIQLNRELTVDGVTDATPIIIRTGSAATKDALAEHLAPVLTATSPEDRAECLATAVADFLNSVNNEDHYIQASLGDVDIDFRTSARTGRQIKVEVNGRDTTTRALPARYSDGGTTTKSIEHGERADLKGFLGRAFKKGMSDDIDNIARDDFKDEVNNLNANGAVSPGDSAVSVTPGTSVTLKIDNIGELTINNEDARADLQALSDRLNSLANASQKISTFAEKAYELVDKYHAPPFSTAESELKIYANRNTQSKYEAINVTFEGASKTTVDFDSKAPGDHYDGGRIELERELEKSGFMKAFLNGLLEETQLAADDSTKIIGTLKDLHRPIFSNSKRDGGIKFYLDHNTNGVGSTDYRVLELGPEDGNIHAKVLIYGSEQGAATPVETVFDAYSANPAGQTEANKIVQALERVGVYAKAWETKRKDPRSNDARTEDQCNTTLLNDFLNKGAMVKEANFKLEGLHLDPDDNTYKEKDREVKIAWNGQTYSFTFKHQGHGHIGGDRGGLTDHEKATIATFSQDGFKDFVGEGLVKEVYWNKSSSVKRPEPTDPVFQEFRKEVGSWHVLQEVAKKAARVERMWYAMPESGITGGRDEVQQLTGREILVKWTGDKHEIHLDGNLGKAFEDLNIANRQNLRLSGLYANQGGCINHTGINLTPSDKTEAFMFEVNPVPGRLAQALDNSFERAHNPGADPGLMEKSFLDKSAAYPVRFGIALRNSADKHDARYIEIINTGEGRRELRIHSAVQGSNSDTPQHHREPIEFRFLSDEALQNAMDEIYKYNRGVYTDDSGVPEARNLNRLIRKIGEKSELKQRKEYFNIVEPGNSPNTYNHKPNPNTPILSFETKHLNGEYTAEFEIKKYNRGARPPFDDTQTSTLQMRYIGTNAPNTGELDKAIENEHNFREDPRKSELISRMLQQGWEITSASNDVDIFLTVPPNEATSQTAFRSIRNLDGRVHCVSDDNNELELTCSRTPGTDVPHDKKYKVQARFISNDRFYLDGDNPLNPMENPYDPTLPFNPKKHSELVIQYYDDKMYEGINKSMEAFRSDMFKAPGVVKENRKAPGRISVPTGSAIEDLMWLAARDGGKVEGQNCEVMIDLNRTDNKMQSFRQTYDGPYQLRENIFNFKSSLVEITYDGINLSRLKSDHLNEFIRDIARPQNEGETPDSNGVDLVLVNLRPDITLSNLNLGGDITIKSVKKHGVLDSLTLYNVNADRLEIGTGGPLLDVRNLYVGHCEFAKGIDIKAKSMGEGNRIVGCNIGGPNAYGGILRLDVGELGGLDLAGCIMRPPEIGSLPDTYNMDNGLLPLESEMEKHRKTLRKIKWPPLDHFRIHEPVDKYRYNNITDMYSIFDHIGHNLFGSRPSARMHSPGQYQKPKSNFGYSEPRKDARGNEIGTVFGRRNHNSYGFLEVSESQVGNGKNDKVKVTVQDVGHPQQQTVTGITVGQTFELDQRVYGAIIPQISMHAREGRFREIADLLNNTN